jgi:ectoine hydroxylase-related dioxygenase (phytanoyl-CoA dioxygenase family)
MKVLTRQQQQQYNDDGYLLLEGFVSSEWVDRLTRAMNRFVEESRTLTKSTASILLEPAHTPEHPRLRRVPHTVAWDPDFEAFGLRGPLLDLAEDLLGPDIRFHHSKLNFKWQAGGEAVRWHQDIQFWPHTNYSPLTIGVYLTDVDDTMAPMGVIPGSHRGPLFALSDATGKWTGSISDEDLKQVDVDSAVWLKGPRGSVTVHNCRMIHGSQPNDSPNMRPLLLHTYAAADAIPITRLMDGVKFSNVLVRGKAPKFARFDADPCPLPPDFKQGEYSSIFAVQKGEM